MRAVLHYTAGPRLRALLAELSHDGVEVSWSPEGDDDALAAALPDAEAILHVLEPITAGVIAAAPRLRFIQKLGAGVNTIDLDAARARGVIVANLPGANAPAVAEMAVALMLAVLRRLPSFDRETRAGSGWPLDPSVPERLGEVGGKVVGLVGYGSIARRVGAMVEAMGATVVHHRRHGAASGCLRLDELLATSDIVSVHVPLTDDTSLLLDARRLGLMKPTAVLVNTSRGGVVDQPALTEALAAGRLAGAGLDVFSVEPIDPADPLLRLGNVVVSPHVAWLTADTLERCVRLGVENCRRLQRGEAVEHRVV
jgi:phosphoglycerate dehydrogenase-like enzyme